MWLAIVVLCTTVLGAGWLTRFIPTAHTTWMKPLLAFSGAYLFTLTITHLLPEALQLAPDAHRVGYFVLAGFFGQLLLEVFSQGVEHGHVHVHPHTGHAGRVPFLLLFALVLHSFLEGSILVRTPAAGDMSRNFYTIVAGVALHHIPAAFALMAALMLRLGSFARALPFLVLFALASPAGVLVSNYVALDALLQGGWYAALLGLVAGNFLHVSTTILFETSPEHRLNLPKLTATVLGAGLALVVS